jgi:hypothetical protein
MKNLMITSLKMQLAAAKQQILKERALHQRDRERIKEQKELIRKQQVTIQAIRELIDGSSSRQPEAHSARRDAALPSASLNALQMHASTGEAGCSSAPKTSPLEQKSHVDGRVHEDASLLVELRRSEPDAAAATNTRRGTKRAAPKAASTQAKSGTCE